MAGRKRWTLHDSAHSFPVQDYPLHYLNSQIAPHVPDPATNDFPHHYSYYSPILPSGSTWKLCSLLSISLSNLIPSLPFIKFQSCAFLFSSSHTPPSFCFRWAHFSDVPFISFYIHCSMAYWWHNCHLNNIIFFSHKIYYTYILGLHLIACFMGTCWMVILFVVMLEKSQKDVLGFDSFYLQITWSWSLIRSDLQSLAFLNLRYWLK